MSPVIRIILRYLIGFVAAKGLIPSDFGAMITDSPEAIDAIGLGLCGAAGICVESAYAIAKKRGWRL